jgi:phosphatidylserine decarboxylase
VTRFPIAFEGWPFILPAVAAVLLCAVLQWRVAAAITLVLALFVTWFFRDPERTIPADPETLVSPADGKVIEVVPQADGGTQISIFLSIFNVHVNRSPVAGEVVEVSRRPGKFLAAWKHEASSDNVQASVTVRTPRGDVRFVQITGLIARRIVCRLSPGMAVARGERYGLIRFGSRMDIFLPPTAGPSVRVGDRVRGGADVIARWRPPHA